MRTGPWPALNEGRSASPPAQSFPVVASMVFAALGSQRPIAPKVMGYLGDRLRHSERARPPHPDRSRPPSGVLLRPAMFRSFRCADRLRPIPPGDRQVSANFRPELWPAVEGGGKGRKSGFRHVLMLWGKILSNDRSCPASHCEKMGRRFEDVHTCPGILRWAKRGRVRFALDRLASAPHRSGILMPAPQLACARAARPRCCRCGREFP